MIYAFKTRTVVPIMAFTNFGMNAKPNTHNPIGFFGTGLKYAVSVILRMGGKIRLLIDGTEYEFYTSSKDFRGKEFQMVRMKKRKGILSKWQYEALPFTTELGKNWTLWQAFRELESNTRDENGTSGVTETTAAVDSKGYTIIEVDCNNFIEVAGEKNQVFLDEKGPLVFENDVVSIYDSPSKYLYYQGVRVYDMRYPARMTYNFKKGTVDLSEDRSARNSFLLFYRISDAIMRQIDDKPIIYKMLHTPNENVSHFEGHDLSFNSTEYGISDVFKEVAKQLGKKGFASTAIKGAYYSYTALPSVSNKVSIELQDDDWKVVMASLETALANKWNDNLYRVFYEMKEQLQ